LQQKQISFDRKLDATLCSQFTDAGFLALAQVIIF